MKISVDVKGIDAAKAHLVGMGKQVAFAASKALNATGKKIADAMPAEIDKAIDKPTPFTRRGVRVLKYANKANLETTVGFMAAQARYMKWATDGGTRDPGAAGLRIPAAIKVNEFGNIPRGVIGQLIAVARKEAKLGKAKSRRIAVSRDVELFYGDPTDQTGKPWPRGIYKHIKTNGRSQLIPLVIFPVKRATYRQRLDFPAIAAGIVRREWDRTFAADLAAALMTAR